MSERRLNSRNIHTLRVKSSLPFEGVSAEINSLSLEIFNNSDIGLGGDWSIPRIGITLDQVNQSIASLSANEPQNIQNPNLKQFLNDMETLLKPYTPSQSLSINSSRVLLWGNSYNPAVDTLYRLQLLDTIGTNLHIAEYTIENNPQYRRQHNLFIAKIGENYSNFSQIDPYKDKTTYNQLISLKIEGLLLAVASK